MSLLSKYLIPGLGIACLALALALGLSMRANASKAERITTLEIAVQQSAQVLTARNAQIEALTQANDSGAAQAAQQCAAQGSGSYLRGVEVGKAIGARQCAS